MEQNYFMVNELNVVDNLVVWDGNPDTWQPPAGYTMLVQATTPAMNWELDGSLTPPDYVLREVGLGDIGYTWNGTVLMTNRPKPEFASTPKPLPVS